MNNIFVFLKREGTNTFNETDLHYALYILRNVLNKHSLINVCNSFDSLCASRINYEKQMHRLRSLILVCIGAFTALKESMRTAINYPKPMMYVSFPTSYQYYYGQFHSLQQHAINGLYYNLFEIPQIQLLQNCTCYIVYVVKSQVR